MPKIRSRRKSKTSKPTGPDDLDAELDALLAVLQELSQSDPVAFAAELVTFAGEVPDDEIARGLLRKALELDPDCSDALLALADLLPPDGDESLACLQAAVETAERALGQEAFVELAGEFWGFSETRPYMHARFELALCHKRRGETEAAQEHFRALLALNPNDNQGVRYSLAASLHDSDGLGELETLLRRYEEEDSPFWTYAWALLEYKLRGAGPESDARLSAAFASNRFVPDLLSGRRKMPSREPDHYSPGDRNEAHLYAIDARAHWAASPGALEWLRSPFEASRSRSRLPRP